jgi:hypothetical protein
MYDCGGDLGFFTVMTLLEGKDMKAVKQKWSEVSIEVVEDIRHVADG